MFCQSTLAIAAGALRSALDNVSRNCSSREFIPLLQLPAEAMNHGSERQRGIRLQRPGRSLRQRPRPKLQRERKPRCMHSRLVCGRESQLSGSPWSMFSSLAQPPRNSSILPDTSSPSTTATLSEGAKRRTSRAQAIGFTPPAFAITLIWTLAGAAARCAQSTAENRARSRDSDPSPSVSGESTW